MKFSINWENEMPATLKHHKLMVQWFHTVSDACPSAALNVQKRPTRFPAQSMRQKQQTFEAIKAKPNYGFDGNIQKR